MVVPFFQQGEHAVIYDFFVDGQISTFGTNMTAAPVLIKSSKKMWHVLHAQEAVVAQAHALGADVPVVVLFRICTSSPLNSAATKFLHTKAGTRTFYYFSNS